jgi:hypothetical protein
MKVCLLESSSNVRTAAGTVRYVVPCREQIRKKISQENVHVSCIVCLNLFPELRVEALFLYGTVR